MTPPPHPPVQSLTPGALYWVEYGRVQEGLVLALDFETYMIVALPKLAKGVTITSSLTGQDLRPGSIVQVPGTREWDGFALVE